ncbi:hypothetical protein PBY51_001425 [Eleginops maclovinus]|uniref:Secreted protein n=1 Tax=Eleginops maclovinus TaxID=56733 RepID=A0AAN8A047_ELEMC|nr:hypothetical protein PBY51_001425 [Eleginops maclovinus]
MFVLVHRLLCLRSPLMCVLPAESVCSRSPVATQITLSLWSQSPVDLFSAEDEGRGLPSTRTRSKKKQQAGLSLRANLAYNA